MKRQPPRDESWEVEWFPEPYMMGGSAHYVSDDATPKPPAILVPDGAGDYREHLVYRPKRRMGF